MPAHQATRECNSTRPARRDGLEIFELEDEAVVYDLARDTVHYLNRTARSVWERCDGVRSLSDIERELLTALVDADSNPVCDERIVVEGIGESIEMLRRDGLLKRIDL